MITWTALGSPKLNRRRQAISLCLPFTLRLARRWCWHGAFKLLILYPVWLMGINANLLARIWLIGRKVTVQNSLANERATQLFDNRGTNTNLYWKWVSIISHLSGFVFLHSVNKCGSPFSLFYLFIDSTVGGVGTSLQLPQLISFPIWSKSDHPRQD